MTAHDEPIIDPDLPIVDSHHHLYSLSEAIAVAMERGESILERGLAPVIRRYPRYLFEDLLVDVMAGHNVQATVFVECHAMYSLDGPEEMRSVGEVEFANGVAAMAASGAFGRVKACAGIIGNVDLRLGNAAEGILQAHLQAGGGRYRGIRCGDLTAYDEDRSIVGGGEPNLLQHRGFLTGFKFLERLGLTFDIFILEPQLPEVIVLARAFPETRIIVNHAGVPLNVASYCGRKTERFEVWRNNIHELSRCDSVFMKLGGFGLPLGVGLTDTSGQHTSSAELARAWKPYVQTCIEAFGADRCMFESNYPVDSTAGSYVVLWNAFKRLASGASEREKNALFSGTAKNVYRLAI